MAFRQFRQLFAACLPAIPVILLFCLCEMLDQTIGYQVHAYTRKKSGQQVKRNGYFRSENMIIQHGGRKFCNRIQTLQKEYADPGKYDEY